MGPLVIESGPVDEATPPRAARGNLLRVKTELVFAALALVGCAGAQTAPIAPTARTSVIHVQHPRRVGDRWHVVADDESSLRTVARVADAPPVDSIKTTYVHVAGTVVVDELQANGRSPLRDETTVDELWTTLDLGAKQVLAPPGAHVVIARAAKKEDALVTVDGAPASQAVRDAVDPVFTLTTYTGPSDDDVFGTTAPQSIGGEWAINQALAEKSLIASGIVASPGAVTGTTKLVGVQSIDGIECLELEVRMTVGAVQSIGSLPPGSTIQSASIDVGLHVLMPPDETRAVSRSDMTMTMKGTFTVPSPRGPVVVSLDSIKHARSEQQPVVRIPGRAANAP
jgi:hypothetical protein